MRGFLAVVLLIYVQNTTDHRDVSDTFKERQDIKQAMFQSLLSIKASLKAKTKDTNSLSEQALYLMKSAEFSVELFPKISTHSLLFTERYLKLIEQTAQAYELSLTNNQRQFSTQIQRIENTCNRCHSLRTFLESATHKTD